jgi:hypothetical protein
MVEFVGMEPHRAVVERGTSERWFGVGAAALPTGHEAGRAAAEQALGGRDAALLIVFATDAYEARDLLAGVNEASEGAPLVGCSTAGELSDQGPADSSVVVAAIGGDGFDVATASGLDSSSGLRAAGAAAARCHGELPEGGNRVMVLLSDGRSGDQAEVIRGVHEEVGSGLPLAGGCAGDAVRSEGTFQLHGDRVHGDSVVAAAIRSDGPIGLGWSHGWENVGEPVLVTRSSGNRIDELDDGPALDRYLDHFEAPEAVRGDAEAFSEWARLHPLGLGRRRTGQQPARCVNAADFEKRALICTAEVPQGGLAWFMRGDVASVLNSTRNACAQALIGFDGAPPLGMLAFNCIGRRGILGPDGIRREADLIGECSGAPFAGFYTLGEIARTRGVNAVHSQTLVALALG